MSPRRPRRTQAPPPLPQARQVTPMQRRLNLAVPYIVVLVVVLPIIAYIHHRITTGGADFTFAFPRGQWGETVREVLLWGVLPLLILALVVWVGLAKRVARTATLKYSRGLGHQGAGVGAARPLGQFSQCPPGVGGDELAHGAHGAGAQEETRSR